jgi:subtilisin family serine protease
MRAPAEGSLIVLTGACRSLTLFAIVLLLMLAALPQLGAGANNDGIDEPFGPSIDRPSDRLKHPRIDSQLMERVEQADTLSAKTRSGEGTSLVAVTVRVSGDPAPVADQMKARGALIANVGEEIIEAYAPVSELMAVAALDTVLTVRELEPPVPMVTLSQGVAIHGAPVWNGAGFNGTGVKVGVIDVGFSGYSSLIGLELPIPVARCYRAIGVFTASLADCERGGVHGTAVAETVVDVAPNAIIYIANPMSHKDLHDTVTWMASHGVAIVNHSVGWGYEGPGDGTSTRVDGPLAAVDRAVGAGITWVNAAGNEAMSTWSGGYLDADGNTSLEFAPGVEMNGIYVHAGYELVLYLRWDDSWASARTDLDLFLVSDDGSVLRSSQSEQSGASGHEPYERIRFRPTASGMVFAVIVHYSGPAPGWIQLQALSGESLQYRSPGYSITNPADSRNPGMLAVGAAPWTKPQTIAPYSSQGPTRDGRIKPDVVGIDFADTVSYGSSGFSGTSQAAPHVAGLAALVKQRYPSFTPTEIASYLKMNASQASSPNNVWGHGLALLPPVDGTVNPQPSITSITPSSVSPGIGPIEAIVTGTGFIPTSIVRWNGGDRPTVYISSLELRVALAAGDLAAAGSAIVTVFNPGPGGGVSTALNFAIGASQNPAPDDPAYSGVWSRTDLPVAQLMTSRTWIWGDEPIFGPVWEPYEESQGQQRAVKYFDKSRMEINDPSAARASEWFVTNGLLVVELISGRMQVGDDAFDEREPAEVNVAGDPGDQQGPTYATFGPLMSAPAAPDDGLLTERVSRNGAVTVDPSLAVYDVTAAYRVSVPGIDHQVASPFWAFMNSSGLVYEDGEFFTAPLFLNPFYATGFPITEAYWATVEVGGIARYVLIQCFERRCLTYTPDNPPGWQVEAGNVGRHYYIWRYGVEPGS